MKLELIRDLSLRYQGGLRQLAKDIGMSEANLHRCINRNQIQANALEAISRQLGVNPDLFFDDTTEQQRTIPQIQIKETLQQIENNAKQLTNMIHQVQQQINP